MKVKRYVVDSMPDAMQKIRSELGKNAVILNTKDVKIGGFLGLFGKKKIEVIAAADSTSDVKSQPPVTSDTPSFIGTSSNPYQTAVGLSSPNTETSTAVAVLEQEQGLQHQMKIKEEQKHSDSLAQRQDSDDDLRDELKQIKQMLRKISVHQETTSDHSETMQRLKQRLLAQEVSEELIEHLLSDVAQMIDEPNEQALNEIEAIRSALQKRFPVEQVEGISDRAKIVNFVGPTGVGKTTTIAKLAAEQVLQQHKKIGFITSDTYRIAAVDQLRTYAEILNVPMEVVFSPQEFKKAYEKLKDCDLIFMDTAGRNYRNEMYVSELNSLLSVQENNETYLVLSLTAKYPDMKQITENFSKFKLDKVLFTKMDETDSYGAIFNLAYDFQLKFSYITNGQNVPHDIQQLNVMQLIDQLLGEVAS